MRLTSEDIDKAIMTVQCVNVMKTWILRMLLAFAAMTVTLPVVAQSYKEDERFKEALKNYQERSVADKLKVYPEYFNIDGTLKVYAVDTINANRVELILNDSSYNSFAVVDMTAPLSPENINPESIYLLFHGTVFCFLPFAEKLNAFCDRYFFEIFCFDDTERTFTDNVFDRPDYEGEGYWNYFYKHALIYCGKPYLEYSIITKPLYYMVFLMTGKSYNEIVSRFYSSEDNPKFIPIEFPDPTAYYRVLVPVFQECE